MEEWGHDEYTLSTYYFLMSYEYFVNNEVYMGHQITSDVQGYLQPFIPNILKWRYPKNKEVEVYYNPQNVNEVVLEPGARPQLYFYLLCSAILSVIILTYAIRLFLAAMCKSGYDKRRCWGLAN